MPRPNRLGKLQTTLKGYAPTMCSGLNKSGLGLLLPLCGLTRRSPIRIPPYSGFSSFPERAPLYLILVGGLKEVLQKRYPLLSLSLSRPRLPPLPHGWSHGFHSRSLPGPAATNPGYMDEDGGPVPAKFPGKPAISSKSRLPLPSSQVGVPQFPPLFILPRCLRAAGSGPRLPRGLLPPGFYPCRSLGGRRGGGG